MKPKTIKTKSILKLIDSKPSNALIAMVEGLKEQSKRKNFQVCMAYFGASNSKGICFGCAATCTIQKLAGENLVFGTIEGSERRAEALSFSLNELERFECAMDFARLSRFENLFKFCEIKYNGEYDAQFTLGSDWKKELPKVEKLIKTLQAAGL